jgi:nucleoside-diphosphate-sugar epimerase
VKIFIIGLGWLGLPLAHDLDRRGHIVAGTTRTADKQAQLIKHGYPTYLFDMFQGTASLEPSQPAIRDSHVVINIAPGRRNIDAPVYTAAMKQLIEFAVDSGAAHITFISTTSVFGDKQGRLCESSEVAPTSQSGLAHAAIESFLLEKHVAPNSILRLAGLVGQNGDGSLRHPVYSLVKRNNIENAQQVVNLVHQQDAIACIAAIIERGDSAGSNNIYHACALEHPTRQAYYHWAAGELGLGCPDFVSPPINQTQQFGKIVDASSSLNALQVSLRYPSPFDMLQTKNSPE